MEEASAPAGPTCVGHLPPPAVRAEAVGGRCGDQLPEGSQALQGLWGAAVWIRARSANTGGCRQEGGGPQLNHLLKRLIRSSWAPLLVLTKTHWTGRKPPLSAHWGGVWGAELWSRRLDLTSQLPGPRGQRSSGEAGPPTTRYFLSWLLRLAGAGSKVVLTAPRPPALSGTVQLHPILVNAPTLPPAGLTLNLFKES